ncbi:MAG: Tyrosine type site-specific recombinase [Bacteroidetes bacterium]|nr:Tyrosine type site-specific recombinase [Bacteroidota bacterium]
MTSIKAHLNTYRATKQGTYPLVFQILHQRKKKLIYSSYNLHEECFDKQRMRAINIKGKKVPGIDEINEYISSTLYDLKMTLSILEERGIDFSVSDIVNLYALNQNNTYLSVYMNKLIVQLRDTERLGTANAYQSTLNCIMEFVNNDETFSFNDISVRWLHDFIASLQKKRLKLNSIKFYIHILRAVYNRANSEGIFGASSNSPFRKIVFGTIKTEKRAITRDLIIKITHAQVDFDKKLEFSRDLFLFSFYCRGMSFVDMAYLRYSNIYHNTIYYSRSKTKQLLKIKIVDPLRRLIEKYRNDSEFILPILTSYSESHYKQYRSGLRRFNNNLKSLSEFLSLSTPLTSYVARHSWATLAKNSGIPVAVISEGLGHYSEKTTYTYLASFDTSIIDSANKKVVSLCV